MIGVAYPAAARPYLHEAGLGVPGPAAVPEPEPRACQSVTKAGNPCQGTPGDDGFCAAHKPKEGDSAGAVPAVDADPPAQEEDRGEEDRRPQDGEEEDRAPDGA